MTKAIKRGIETPDIYLLKHDMGSGHYAQLRIVSTSTLAMAELASDKHIPSLQFRALDMNGAIEMLEASFVREFPDHVCTNLCERLWSQLPSDEQPSKPEQGTVN